MGWVWVVAVLLGCDLVRTGARELRGTPRHLPRYRLRGWLRAVSGALFVMSGVFWALRWERPLEAVLGPLGLAFGAWWLLARFVATGPPPTSQDR